MLVRKFMFFIVILWWFGVVNVFGKCRFWVCSIIGVKLRMLFIFVVMSVCVVVWVCLVGIVSRFMFICWGVFVIEVMNGLSWFMCWMVSFWILWFIMLGVMLKRFMF